MPEGRRIETDKNHGNRRLFFNRNKALENFC